MLIMELCVRIVTQSLYCLRMSCSDFFVINVKNNCYNHSFSVVSSCHYQMSFTIYAKVYSACNDLFKIHVVLQLAAGI